MFAENGSGMEKKNRRDVDLNNGGVSSGSLDERLTVVTVYSSSISAERHTNWLCENRRDLCKLCVLCSGANSFCRLWRGSRG